MTADLVNHTQLLAQNAIGYWKPVSIGLTGAFGILGLVTEFRDKHTRRITKWGWLSLLGILISSTGGIVAQITESNDNARTAADNSRQALDILKNTSTTVTSINRMMSSLTGVRVDVIYSIDCALKPVGHCGQTPADEERILAKSGLTFYFFVDAAVAKRFSDGAWLTTPADLRWSLGRNTDTGQLGEAVSPGSLNVTIPDYTPNPSLTQSVGNKIGSLVDLPGSTLLVMGNANQLDDVPVQNVTIKIGNGQYVEASQFQRIVIHPTGPYASAPPPVVAYRYVFPK